MSAYAVKVEGLSKQYRIGGKVRYHTLRGDVQEAGARLLDGLRGIKSEVPKLRGRHHGNRMWALKDLTFEIPSGSSTGIIGSNGAGKTTLLKILAHITAPTRGRARLRGRVGSLLEVGTGFHPELTGRENIYLNGAILGMRKLEIDRKFDEIVAFSEIETYLDTPVKHYSSGMSVRLAFSVAAHLEPEILLLDEVLAVGDVNFQKKSLNKMGDVVRGGRTVLFVSHNLAAVKALCESAIYLEHGEVKFLGDVDDAVDTYLGSGELQKVQLFERQADEKLPMQIMSVSIKDRKGNLSALLPHDQPFTLDIQTVVRESITQVVPAVDILDGDLATLIHSDFFAENKEEGIRSYTPGNYSFQVKVPANILVPGNYRLNVSMSKKARRFRRIFDRVEHVFPFEIYDNGSLLAQYGMRWTGKLALPLEWVCSEE